MGFWEKDCKSVHRATKISETPEVCSSVSNPNKDFSRAYHLQEISRLWRSIRRRSVFRP